jgi:cation:H+ antiporter
MFLIWIKFIICSAIILFAGKRVARYGDIIAEKTGLGGLWIGVVLVAVTTSLPEIFTGVGCVSFVDAPDLTVGNLFGANTYNLLNISLLDFLHRGSPLLSSVSLGQLLTAGLSIIPLLVATLGIFLSLRLPAFSLYKYL